MTFTDKDYARDCIRIAMAAFDTRGGDSTYAAQEFAGAINDHPATKHLYEEIRRWWPRLCNTSDRDVFERHLHQICEL